MSGVRGRGCAPAHEPRPTLPLDVQHRVVRRRSRMAQCPNCYVEMKGEERFCPNCGTRVDRDNRSADAPPAPAAAPRTIVLPAAADSERPLDPSEPLAPTTRLPAAEPTPAPRSLEGQPAIRPAPDVTIVAG